MKLFFLFCLSLSIGFSTLIYGQEFEKHCGADELRINTLKQNPTIAKAVIIRDSILEAFTKNFENNMHYKSSTPIYTIPVVFHVIHNYGSENISNEQILDGLDVLNQTFRKQLADTASIVADFKPIHADCEIEFKLAKLDPDGNCTSGINRIASHLTTIGDHSVKSLIHWPPTKYLNVYIVSNPAGLAGHCVWPADADTIPEWDGIVIAHNCVGRIGTSNNTTSVVFAHECGHYLNLHHIWGGNNVPGFYYYPCADPNKDCNIDDFVTDTPPTIGWQTCNLTGASCGNTVDNVQNVMDYSYCNKMFTYGQKARMHACLNSPIAGRNNLWQTLNLIATGVADSLSAFVLCEGDFKSNKNVVCANNSNSITFTNTTLAQTYTNAVWTFQGGNPSTSTQLVPVVTYTTPGKYDVELKLFKGMDSLVILKKKYINVFETTGNNYPFAESFETVNNIDTSAWFAYSFDTINSWQVTSNAASIGAQSIMLNNYDKTESTKDELYSQTLNLTGASSLNLSFKYAYAKKDTSSDDRLQLFITNGCNASWLQRLNIIDQALETAPPTNLAFVPLNDTNWKQAHTLIPTTYLNSNFKFKFVFTSNNGNNLYIDDINLDINASINNSDFSSTLNVFPNPAHEQVKISFSLETATLVSIAIYDVLGQLVFEKSKEIYNIGDNTIVINTKEFKSGFYLLKINDSNNSTSLPLIINQH
ncbi:MAG: M43 family zinc metalloprotease [Bacteroidia bacterium]